MNKIYHVVFNRSLAVWQVVSELAGGNSKSSSTTNESVVDSAKAGLSGVKKSFAKTVLKLAVVSVFGVLATASVHAQVIVDPIKNDVSANISTTDGVVTLDGVNVDWVFTGTSSSLNLGSTVTNGSKGMLTLNNSIFTSNSGSYGYIYLRNGSGLLLDNTTMQFSKTIYIDGVNPTTNPNSELIVRNDSELSVHQIQNINRVSISDASTVTTSSYFTPNNLSITGGSTLNASSVSVGAQGGSLLIKDSTVTLSGPTPGALSLTQQNGSSVSVTGLIENSTVNGAIRMAGAIIGQQVAILTLKNSIWTSIPGSDKGSIEGGTLNITDHSTVTLTGGLRIGGGSGLSTLNIQDSIVNANRIEMVTDPANTVSVQNSQLTLKTLDIGLGNMTVTESDITVLGGGGAQDPTIGGTLTLQNSNVTMNTPLNMGSLPIGNLILNAGSVLSVAGDIKLGTNGGCSTGSGWVINCGGNIFIGGNGTALAPGQLLANNINLADANLIAGYTLSRSTINFNHTDTSGNYIFAGNIHAGNSNSSVNIMAGTTVFTGTGNDYISPTKITGGILRAGAANTLSSNSDYTVNAGTVLDLGGYTQTLASLNNLGTLDFGGLANNGYNPLTITGNVTGSGNFIFHSNLVALNANYLNVLGQIDGNHTIKVIDSSASLPLSNGLETYKIINQGNIGTGVFTLGSDNVVADFGAFTYSLTLDHPNPYSWWLTIGPRLSTYNTVELTGSVVNVTAHNRLTDAWNNAAIGNTGIGTIKTLNGIVIGATGQLQVANGGSGTLTMTEASVINGSGVDITVGSGVNQQGAIHLTQGSSINLGASDSLVLGAAAGSRGEISLTNNGSKLNMQDNTLVLGQQGTGVLTINAGSSVDLNNVQVVLGQQAGSNGSISLNNQTLGSAANNSYLVGDNGIGNMTLSNQSNLNVNQMVLGQGLTGEGTLTVDNTQLKADSFTLGGHGKGTLTLTGNGSLQIDNGGAAGTGTLYFADAFTAGDPNTANGTLSINSANAQVLASTWSLSNSVTPDKGTATINFNHGNVTSGYTVTADIINGNDNSQINLRSGLTTFMGNNTYAGSTQVYNNSELKAGSATALSPNAKYQVDSGGRLDLNGFAHTLAGLSNRGLVDFGGAINNGYNLLTITGDLTGGGNFIMHTNLVTGVGNTIDVQGTVAGNHKITVVDSSASLPTGGERFTIVTQGNATGGGNFTMAGTQIAGATTRAVSFGAFQYDVTIAQAADGLSWQIAALPGVAPTTPPPVTPLVPPGGGGNNGGGNTGGNNGGGSNNGGGNTGGNNGGSPLIPQVYDPARLSKAANMIMGTQASVMTALNGQMDIMHSRTRELSSSPMALAAQFATTPYNMYASNGDNLPSSAPNNWSANQPTISLWTQGFRNKNTIDNGSSRSFDQRNDGLSLGGDYALVLKEGVVFIGAMVGKSKSEQTFDDPSSSELKNDFVGLYSTYAGADGLRISGGIQLSYLKSDLTVVDNIGQQFSGDYRQLGVSTSLELGYRFDLANAYFIEPRVGVQTTSVGKEEYTLSNGLKSSDSGFDIVQGRLGVMAGKQFHLDSGGIVRTFVEGSAVNTLSGDADITINNAELLKNNMVGNYMELGAGVSYLFADRHQLSLGFQYRDGNKFTSPWGANMSYLVRF